MTELWQLPVGWRWARFDEVASVASDLVDPSRFGTLPHIAPNHIESQTGRLLPFRTIAEDGVTSPKHRFHAGQVLYSKIRPYLAKVVIAGFDGLCSADMYPIDTQLNSQFLKWWMLTPAFTRMASGEQGRTVLPKINKRALRRLHVPVPPDEEQHRIVDILEDHLSRLDAAEHSLEAASARMRAFRERATVQAITGAALGGRRIQPTLSSVGTADGDLPWLPTDWYWARLGDVADVVGGITKDAKRQSDPSFEEVPYLRVANVQRGYLNLDQVTRIRVDPALTEFEAVAAALEAGSTRP